MRQPFPEGMFNESEDKIQKEQECGSFLCAGQGDVVPFFGSVIEVVAF